jgi:1-acyl-sn-glycerol-3-phosphate acyltransferase
LNIHQASILKIFLNILTNIPRFIYAIYALIIFIATMLLVVTCVVIASFFGRIRGGNAIFRLCTLWSDTWFFFVGIRHQNFYEAPHDKSKNYIFVANHISYIDAPILVKALRQRVRVLGKIETSKVPVFGYIYRKAVVTVDRSNPAARANSVRILKSVLTKNISIFIFPEGTFNETHQPLKSFYDGAFRLAIEMQTPVKPVLFLDAYDRMCYEKVFHLTPGRSRAIFLEEVPTQGLTIEDLESLKQRVHGIMSDKLIEYRAPWIRPEKTAINP